MTDSVYTWPSVITLWGDDFTATPDSAEYVSAAVATFFSNAEIAALWSVYEAKPLNWDDPPNFTSPDGTITWGASAYVYSSGRRQGKLYTGNGKPLRTVIHDVTLVGLFKSQINDTTAATVLQRRIEDSIVAALQASPNLGSTTYQAGIADLTSIRDVAKWDGQSHNIRFEVAFPVQVYTGG